MAARIKGGSERLTRKHNERSWLAWHIAALTRAKKMPALDKMQIKKNRRVTPWQEQLAAWEAYAATQAH